MALRRYQARVIGQVADAFGDEWDLREQIDSGHGWPLCIGWPSGYPRGKGGVGGARVILTEELVDHLEAVRHDLRPIPAARLPLGRAQMKRLRALLEHNRKSDRRAWWEDHIEDLESLPHTEFAAKHGVSPGAVEQMHQSILGSKRGRPAAWWRDEQAIAVLRSGLPIVLMAEQLGRTIRAVWTARSLLGIEDDRRRWSKS